MNEMRPHGEHSAAGWDGVERRAAAAVPAAVRSPWRSPDRMRGQILARLTGHVGATAAIWAVQLLAEHIQLTLR
ncbi:hypothetical protein ACIGZJ_34365 [Kitasatospora sp. NPDC052868]|uniref:hypothetical protein n=1 Tax=Kitasatospora sp. NPDC052868 TaxID=3364060 RepID=UPI0037C83B90